jgi:integrase/recombinase XerD
MFHKIFSKPYAIKHHIDAPLLAQRLEYLEYYRSRGRSTYTLTEVAQYLLRIIEFLKLEDKKTISVEEIENAANAWAQYQYNHPQKRRKFSHKSKNAFIRYATDWLKRLDRLRPPPKKIELFYKIFERRHFIKRHSEAPLLEERLKYLQHLNENGYPLSSLKGISAYLLRVMEFLHFENKKRLITIKDINKAADKWARYQTTSPFKRVAFSNSAKRYFIWHATNWLEMIGYLRQPAKAFQPFAKQLSAYIAYMQHEQGLSKKTIDIRCRYLKDFFGLVWGKTHNLANINILMVDQIIEYKSNVKKYARTTLQTYAGNIRSFLRYAERQNWCKKGVHLAIKTPRAYNLSTLPRGPSWDDVKKLLTKTEGNSPTKIRDRAILMLLAVYGLRRGEVANLQFDDIDWKNEILKLNRVKSGKPQIFPLCKTVANAIVRYIQEVRPKDCNCKNVFICMRPPIHAIDGNTIYALVSRYMKSVENIKTKNYGPHALRHACATHLINQEVSLKEISDHLGHKDIEATRIYAKVNLTELRKVADFDLGGVLCC